MTRELAGARSRRRGRARRARLGGRARPDLACYLKPEQLVETLEALHDDAEADLVHLTNLCGVDYWDHFEVVYHIQSFDEEPHRAAQGETSRTTRTRRCRAWCPVWHGAWMQEREAYDLMGIRFEGHPNLHRIFLWEGYPGLPAAQGLPLDAGRTAAGPERVRRRIARQEAAA